MKLSEYIKNYRKSTGISLRQMASQCGLSYQYISNLENDQVTSPTLKIMKQIASGTGITLHQLLVIIDEIDVSMDRTQADRLLAYVEELSKFYKR